MKTVECKEGTLHCTLLYWSTRLFGGGEHEAKQKVRARLADEVLQMVDSRTQNLAERILTKTQ